MIGKKEGKGGREEGKKENEKEGKKKRNAYLHTCCFQLPKGIFLSLWSQRYRILGTYKGPDKRSGSTFSFYGGNKTTF